VTERRHGHTVTSYILGVREEIWRHQTAVYEDT